METKQIAAGPISPKQIEDMRLEVLDNKTPDWFSADVTANGITIRYYRTGGDKLPLVLSHGVTDTGLSWQHVARELEQDYDVIMYDQRGHGFSDAPHAGYNFEDQARDLAGLIAALHLERPHILGHSGGAAAVAILAANYPDLPASIVLEDPPLGSAWGDWEAMQERIKQWFSKIVSMTPDELAAYCQASNPHWPDDVKALWVGSKLQVNPNVSQGFDQPAPPWSDLVRKIKCPLLLLAGDREKGAINTAEDILRIAAFWNQGQAIRIAGAGHMIHVDRLEPFVATVKTFLTAVDNI